MIFARNNTAVKTASKILSKKFKDCPFIISAYIYGSVLTKNFSQNSDIDVLFIVEDTYEPNIILEKIKEIRDTITDFKLDLNIVFLEEFKKRWHIYRPPTYFYWIKQRNKLIWGKQNLIKEIRADEITAESLLKRAVDLAQSSRSVYLNNKEADFWVNKYKRWIRTLICEIHYLDNKLETDYKKCVKNIVKKYPKYNMLKIVMEDNITMKQITSVAEELIYLIRKNFI